MAAPPNKPKSKHCRKRTPSQIAADLALIEHWVCRGKSISQITDILNSERPSYKLSRAQIGFDLQKVDDMWKASAVAERDKSKRLELAGLRKQEDELWESWEKSKKEKLEQSVEQSQDGASNGATERAGASKRKVKTTTTCGDPQFMRLILDVRAQRRALLGLDEIRTDKIEVTGKDGAPLIPPDVANALELAYGRDDASKALAQFTEDAGTLGPLRH